MFDCRDSLGRGEWISSVGKVRVIKTTVSCKLSYPVIILYELQNVSVYIRTGEYTFVCRYPDRLNIVYVTLVLCCNKNVKVEIINK